MEQGVERGIGGVLEGVWADFPITLMAPVTFLQRPRRWLEAITRTRATISGGPNFAYELCSRRIRPDERAALDLRSWRLAFNGAEPIRRSTLERFAITFGPVGFDRGQSIWDSRAVGCDEQPSGSDERHAAGPRS